MGVVNSFEKGCMNRSVEMGQWLKGKWNCRVSCVKCR